MDNNRLVANTSNNQWHNKNTKKRYYYIFTIKEKNKFVRNIVTNNFLLNLKLKEACAQNIKCGIHDFIGLPLSAEYKLNLDNDVWGLIFTNTARNHPYQAHIILERGLLQEEDSTCLQNRLA